MHPPRHLAERHGTAQAPNLHRKSPHVSGVGREKIQLFVLHTARLAVHAMHGEIEVDLPSTAREIARPSPALAVMAATYLAASAASRFFERRRNVSTNAGCSNSS